jgi:glycosyltransferase involved in cell wall biosynthesis
VTVRSVHVIGSRGGGGAERFYVRLVQALHETGEPTFAVAQPGSAVAGALAGKVPCTGVRMRNVYDPIARWQISRAVRRMDADVVQTYMGRATRLTRLGRGPRPLHVARLGNYYKLDGYRHAHAWVANTTGIRDYLVQNGFPAERVFLIPNFVDPAPAADTDAIAALRNTLRLPGDALVVLGSGRFTRIKGFDVLLEAFARLPATINGREPRLVLVGDGPERDALQAQSRRLGLQPRVSWTGWQNEPGPYYDLADAVAFPCRRTEPFGNVIFEAWAHRRAVVTTRSLGALESTHHGRDAWHADCEDAGDLARALAIVLADPGLRDELGARGATKLASEYGRERAVQAYLHLYHKLLGTELSAGRA